MFKKYETKERSQDLSSESSGFECFVFLTIRLKYAFKFADGETICILKDSTEFSMPISILYLLLSKLKITQFNQT